MISKEIHQAKQEDMNTPPPQINTFPVALHGYAWYKTVKIMFGCKDNLTNGYKINYLGKLHKQ